MIEYDIRSGHGALSKYCNTWKHASVWYRTYTLFCWQCSICAKGALNVRVHIKRRAVCECVCNATFQQCAKSKVRTWKTGYRSSTSKWQQIEAWSSQQDLQRQARLKSSTIHVYRLFLHCHTVLVSAISAMYINANKSKIWKDVTVNLILFTLDCPGSPHPAYVCKSSYS